MLKKIGDKKFIGFVVNLVILAVLGYALYARLPNIINNFRLQNSKIESTQIRRISGEEISIPDLKKNKIVIFWATWCGPCHYEMKKLNEMVSQGKIKPDDLIAVSIDENKDEVLKFIEQENYQFLVAHDSDGSLSRKFKITSTPTILFVNKNSNIDWMTSGISPMLEPRIKNFLKD